MNLLKDFFHICHLIIIFLIFKTQKDLGRICRFRRTDIKFWPHLIGKLFFYVSEGWDLCPLGFHSSWDVNM